MVIWYLDRQSNTLSNKLSIYRKPSHSRSYIHSLYQQLVSTKMSVIRSLFLRAYRYCDPQFLDNELEKIYTDFSRLGYNRRFIVKAKISAKKGRYHEIKVRAGIVKPFHLVLPYHKKTRGLKQRYVERVIEVIYTSRDSLDSRDTWRKRVPMESGVYILKCIDSSCDRFYVGESRYFPRRFDEHSRTIGCVKSLKRYATARHKHPSSVFMLDAVPLWLGLR